MSPEAIRVVSEEQRALPEFFELSTEDRKQASPSLSVWVEGLTSIAQAWVLVGAARKRSIVLTLSVDQIRALRPEPAEPVHPGLDVLWEPATLLDESGVRVPESRPGSEGHAGITRLDDGFGTRAQRKDLRAQLARAATVRILSEVELDQISTSS